MKSLGVLIRVTLAVLLAGIGLTGGTGTAHAAPPANDDRSTPEVVEGSPLQAAGDTSQATADPTDPTPSCSIGPLAGTLWYSWTPATTANVVVDLQAGAGTVPIAAFYTADDVGGLMPHACTVGGQATFEFVGGQTYLFMVGQYTGCCSPGPFVLTLTPEGPPPPPYELGLSVGSTAVLGRLPGTATISGSIRCNTAGWATVSGEIRQLQGRNVVRGSGSTDVACTSDAPVGWSFLVDTGSRSLQLGKATVAAQASGCSQFSCDMASATVQVKVAKR